MQKHGFGLRGLLAAIVVIVLSAGAVAAAGPPEADHGLATAAEKAGKTVPVAAQEENEDEETEETVEDESSENADHCSVDPTTADETVLAELNHGAIVCWAAHQETPDEFDNHGAWVSSWAKDNHGHEDAAEDAAAAAGNSGNHGKPEGAGKP